MSSSKAIGFIGVLAGVLALVLVFGLFNYEALGIRKMPRQIGYEERIFDTSKVHTIDIQYDDWAEFIRGCTDEMYIDVNAKIDGEEISNVALRAKGNTSLSSVQNAGSVRYSFKMEFDHFEGSSMYYGLDKLCLNNIIQDPSYMKDYLAYRMMDEFGVDAPLCSYAWITVNGEPWGLYLAVEAVEDSFMERNYGLDNGNLYKPDSMSMGAGPGNGQDFDMATFLEENGVSQEDIDVLLGEATEEEEETVAAEQEQGFDPFGGGGFSFGGGGDDVSLVYSDDEVSSYKNIITSAKRPVSARDIANVIKDLKKLGEMRDLEDILDMDEVLRYFVVHNYTQNGDSYTGSMIHNYYLYIEENGKMHMIPWDYNLGYGTFSGGGGFGGGSGATSTINAPIDAATLSSDTDTSKPMANWIFADETYTKMYNDLYQEFLDEVDILGIIEEAYALISPYIPYDPTAFYTVDEIQLGYDTLYAYCQLRSQSVQGQLDGTIPKTNAEQRNNSGNSIDGSAINTSDLGGMSNTGSNDPDIDRVSLLGESEQQGSGGGQGAPGADQGGPGGDAGGFDFFSR